MKFASFVSRRLIRDKHLGGSISRPMLRISVVTVALGMVIMLITVATGMGLQREIRNKVIGFNGHIQIVRYDGNASYEQLPLQADSLLAAGLPGAVHLQPTGQKAGILRTEDDFEGVVLKGIDRHFDFNRWGARLLEGRFPFFGAGYQDSILVSDFLRNRLNLQTGQRITMYFLRPDRPPLLRYFTIAGIYQTGLEEFDKTYLMGDLDHVRRLYRWDSTQAGVVEVYLNNPEETEALAASIRKDLPLNLDARTVEQQHEQLFQWLALFDVNIYVILLIMVTVASVNMITSLFILILERTPMIGIFKALGAGNGQLREIFLRQAAYLILMGLFWGNLVGLAFCLGQSEFGWVSLDPETYYVDRVPIYLPWWAWLALNAGTLFICLLAMMIPAHLVTRIRPVRAIKFE